MLCRAARKDIQLEIPEFDFKDVAWVAYKNADDENDEEDQDLLGSVGVIVRNAGGDQDQQREVQKIKRKGSLGDEPHESNETGIGGDLNPASDQQGPHEEDGADQAE